MKYISVKTINLVASETTNKALAIPEDGIETVKEYGDGLKWVKVTGPNSLKREDMYMQAGTAKYARKAKSRKMIVFSLRNKNNIPICTIEYACPLPLYYVLTFRGYKNKTIPAKYISYIQDFINKKYVKYCDAVKFGKSGLVKAGKKVYSIFNLPDPLEVKGDLDFSDMDISKLPQHIKVTGDLDLGDTNITELPDDISVGEDLLLSGLNIKSLPVNLKIGGDLYLGSTNIKLPDNLKLPGSLYLDRSTLTQLPKGLEVGGNLDLSYSKIKALPDDLKVGGSINLTGTPITSIANLRKVNGDLRSVCVSKTT